MRAPSFAAMSASEIQTGLAAKDFSAREVAVESLARIEGCDGCVNAFLEVTERQALEAADRVDRAVASGDLSRAGSLAGVPVAFKDNMNWEGTHTTCASRALQNNVSTYTATCVQRVLDAGAIPLGKLNLDELAFGSSTETSAFGRTLNPWDAQRVPGGSSGGSAAAVAAGMACVTLGSDAGGSIRQPGSFCGVVAVKPSYGTVPGYGVMALAGTLDQVGPFARSVRDAALALDAAAGVEKFAACLAKGVEGMRIGVVPAFQKASGLSAEVHAKVEEAAVSLVAQGACLQEVELPHVLDAISAYYVLGPREAFYNFAAYDPVRYGYDEPCLAELNERDRLWRAEHLGAEVKRRVMLGGYLLSCAASGDYLEAATRARAAIIEDYERAYRQVDCLLAPVTPRTAFKFGEVSDPAEMHLSDVFTVSVNIAGNGAMSVPVGLGADSGLPVGVQLIAPRGKDGNMLRAAAALERVYGEAPVAPNFR